MRTVLFAFFLAGCPSGDPTPPSVSEADTDTDTDTDADTDTDTDADTDSDTDADTDTDADPGNTGSLPTPNTVGYWRIGGAPTAVTVRVDTVSADTTFDPAGFIAAVDVWPAPGETITISDYTPLADPNGEFDDEVPCTFPPPMFSCPEFAVDSTEDFMVAVLVATPGDGATADYVIEANDANGDAVDITFLQNQ